MAFRGLASIWGPHALSLQACQGNTNSVAALITSQLGRASLQTSTVPLEGKGPDAKNSPEQKKGVRTDPDMAPPKDDRQATPSSKKTNELVRCLSCSLSGLTRVAE